MDVGGVGIMLKSVSESELWVNSVCGDIELRVSVDLRGVSRAGRFRHRQ